MSFPQGEESTEEHSLSSSGERKKKKSSSSLPKKKQNPRVARIITNSLDLPPPPKPQANYSSQSAPQKSVSPFLQDQFSQDISSFLQNTQVPLVGRVINGRVCFTLFPKMPKLYCPFDFRHSPGHRVVLVFYPNYTIPYVLNGTPSIYNGTEVDVTNQLRDGDNYLIVNTTAIQEEVVAAIEWRDENTVEDLVQKIIRENPPMEISPVLQAFTDECPIGKKLIQKPGRGCECDHCQCFDLETFINNAQSTGNWNCPVCGKPLSLETLRYDPSYLKNCGSLFLGDDFIEDANSFF